MPSAWPKEPEPARVVTVCVAITICLMLLALESVTYKFALVASIAIPVGAMNVAPFPMPFVVPLAPDPAKVVTTPVEMTICLITWLFTSAIYRFVPSVVMPLGLLNLASVPVASV